jgi:hypothetical protein
VVVGDVHADELVLRMGFDEPGVGDRLAIADGSPGSPDVDEGGLATKVREREPLSVECLAFELDRGRRPGVGVTGGSFVFGTASAGGEGDEQNQEERDAMHRLHRI